MEIIQVVFNIWPLLGIFAILAYLENRASTDHKLDFRRAIALVGSAIVLSLLFTGHPGGLEYVCVISGLWLALWILACIVAKVFGIEILFVIGNGQVWTATILGGAALISSILIR